MMEDQVVCLQFFSQKEAEEVLQVGLGGASLRLVVKELMRSHRVQIAMVQESKLKEVSDKIVKEIWGRRRLLACINSLMLWKNSTPTS